MSDEYKANMKSKEVWLRGFFMLLFAVFYNVAEIVLAVVAVFQFGCTLLTRKPNRNATRFGNSVGQYIFQIAQFVTFNTEERPFPFASWPEPKAAPGPTPSSGAARVPEPGETVESAKAKPDETRSGGAPESGDVPAEKGPDAGDRTP